MDFTLKRDRDAWPTINGFVVQVDLTIERWLDLDEGEELELERGEDIDLIANALVPGGDDRVLEQVKHRANALTLRTPAALEALANFAEHRAANPGLALRFRFTTNARRGVERPPLFEAGVPGLDIWDSLRKHASPDALAKLKEFLASATKPADLSDETWKIFATFLKASDDVAFLEFVQRFEWATGELAGEALGERIRTRLVLLGHARNPVEAKSKYERLFLTIFKLLRNRGIKRLSRDLLLTELSLPTLSEEDANLLQVTVRRLGALEEGLSLVHSRLAEHDVQLAVLRSNSDIGSSSGGAEQPPSSARPSASSARGGGEDLSRMLQEIKARLDASSAPTTPGIADRASQELAVRDGESLYRELHDLLDQWEFEAAYKVAGKLGDYVAQHDSVLPRLFLANAFTLMAETELIRAKQMKMNGAKFDGARVADYLARAKHVAPR